MTWITIPASGSAGIIADEVAQELPDGAWTAGDNVRFSNGYAQRIGGHREVLTDPDAAVYHVTNYRAALGDFWISATLAKIFADDGTTQTEITGSAFTGAATDVFTSCVLGGVLYLNNQKDEPRYWGGDTGDNVATLTGWDSTWRCKALRAFKANVLALNVTKGSDKYPSMVKWSDSTEPGAVPLSWDEADATGDARELDLAETSDKIIDGMALGDVFVVYKDRSMWGLQATGGNDVFRYFRLPGDHGALSQNCIAAYPGGHVVLTPSDVITHNGAGAQSIIDGRMRRWLFSRLDGANLSACFLAHHPARSEVWICIPTGEGAYCSLALIWNYAGNTFGVRELPTVTSGSFGPVALTESDQWDDDTDTWDSDTTTWNQLDVSAADNRLILGSTASRLYLMDQSSSFNGTAFTSRLERSGMALGRPSKVKLLKGVIPRVDAPTGTVLSIQAGASMDAEMSPQWQPAVAYTVGSTYRADLFAQGRFLALRVSGAAGSWRLKSLDLDIIEKGGY